MRWRPSSVRMRLTLWYAAALTIILLLYAVGVYAFVRHSFYGELDRQVNEDFEVAEALLTREGNGGLTWLEHREVFDHETGQEDTGSRGVAAWNREGQLLYYRSPPKTSSLSAPSSKLSGRIGPQTLVLASGERVRQLTSPYTIEELPVVLAVARSEHRLRHELNELLLILLVGLPIAVGLAALGGSFLARRALTPVGRMAERARTITAERLSERLPVDDPNDELGSLATVFNETLARLERSFGEMRRFTGDASHELRTPLTAMRSVGEVGLRDSRDEPAYRAIIGSMLEEVDRMAHLVDALLTLARAGGTQAPLQKEHVDLGDLAREVAVYLQALAEEKGQSVAVEAPGELVVDVDRAVLRQAVVNLVDNAIKHGTAGTAIRIRLEGGSGAAILEVIDAGPGIPAEHRQHVFERFYRVDESRSREHGGTGLGLAIARWAVEIHGGRIELETSTQQGSVFRIVLPQTSKRRTS